MCVCCRCQVLEERRARCADVDSDLVVWTNQRLKQWARRIDLQVSPSTRDDRKENCTQEPEQLACQIVGASKFVRGPRG